MCDSLKFKVPTTAAESEVLKLSSVSSVLTVWNMVVLVQLRVSLLSLCVHLWMIAPTTPLLLQLPLLLLWLEHSSYLWCLLPLLIFAATASLLMTRLEEKSCLSYLNMAMLVQYDCVCKETVSTKDDSKGYDQFSQTDWILLASWSLVVPVCYMVLKIQVAYRIWKILRK